MPGRSGRVTSETTSRYEGGPYSKWSQVIRDVGYNKDTDFEIGEVIAPPPSLKIQVGSLEIEADDVVIAQHLTKYEIPFTASITKAQFESAPLGTLNDDYVDETGAYGEQKKSYHSLGFTFDEGKITLDNSLKAGDRVVIASVDDGQRYIVLDRAVILDGA